MTDKSMDPQILSEIIFRKRRPLTWLVGVELQKCELSMNLSPKTAKGSRQIDRIA